MKKVKWLYSFFLPVLLTGLLISGCENDLKDIQKISAGEVNKPGERYTTVDVIYSDSARVKAHMTTPLMIMYKDKVAKPYTEMPKGVKVIFYDADLKATSTITSEYAVRREAEKRIELRKNVVATNATGDVFTSEELIWDEDARQIHSSKLVHIRFANGNISDGTSFNSDESFNHYTMTLATAQIQVNNQDIAH